MIFFGYAFPIGIFTTICGLASLFGAETVRWNNDVVTGINGLLVALLIFPIITIVATLFTGTFAFVGLWISSKFVRLEYEFVEAELSEKPE